MRTRVWILTWILLFSNHLFAKDWNGIVPCVSTRGEVEVLLRADRSENSLGIYSYRRYRVHILYQSRDTSRPERDLVHRIRVYPRKVQSFAKYKRQIPDFEKTYLRTDILSERHVRSSEAVYRNWSEGFEIWVQKQDDGKEIIDAFGYFDPAWDCSKRSNS